MQLPISSPSNSRPGSRLRRLRDFLLHTGRGRAVLLTILTFLLAGGWWYNEHRTITWAQTVNPFYWLARSRGEDLYDPQTAFLMHGDHGLPEVALTFDDGPHADSRAQILDILKRYGVHATFFDVGKNMKANPDLVRRTLDEGHEIGNHSALHNRLDTITGQHRFNEINNADLIFHRIAGRHLRLLRPPGMRYNDSVLADIRKMGYVVVGYTAAARDAEVSDEITPEFIAQRTLRRTENGSIILLHDYPETARALPAILDGLRERGLHTVTISEMLIHLPSKQRAPAEEFLNHKDTKTRREHKEKQ